MSVNRGRGVRRVSVSLNQTYRMAAWAGSGSKGGGRVEVVSKHRERANRLGATQKPAPQTEDVIGQVA